MTDRTRRRLATVVLAPTAAITAWAVVRLIGIDLALEDGNTVGPVDVVAAALVGALAGWLVVRLVERHSRRPRGLWAFAGSTTLAVSMIGPAWLADSASAVALMSLHVVTAVVLISGFYWTLPLHRDADDSGTLPAMTERRSGTMTG
jgi:ABC-type Co2+ transport system permease subunit